MKAVALGIRLFAAAALMKGDKEQLATDEREAWEAFKKGKALLRITITRWK